MSDTSKSLYKKMSDEELLKALGNDRAPSAPLRELIRRFRAFKADYDSRMTPPYHV